MWPRSPARRRLSYGPPLLQITGGQSDETWDAGGDGRASALLLMSPCRRESSRWLRCSFGRSSWGVDTTPLAWSDDDQARSISHAVPPDFPRTCGCNHRSSETLASFHPPHLNGANSPLTGRQAQNSGVTQEPRGVVDRRSDTGLPGGDGAHVRFGGAGVAVDEAATHPWKAVIANELGGESHRDATGPARRDRASGFLRVARRPP